MNILQISVSDYGGCAHSLAEAIKATTKHDSISARSAPPSYIKYKTHLAIGSPNDIKGIWDWADVVHVHDVMPPLPQGLPTKPTVITYHGSMYRRNPALYNRLVKRFSWVGTVATIDLTAHGLRWMPDCRPPLDKYAYRPDGRYIVAHAPTSRPGKSTNEVIAALDSLVRKGEIVLDVIEMVDHISCLKRKGRASIYIDQFTLCYGLNSIEAWSMGIPVIANAQPQTLNKIKKIMGDLPFYQVPVNGVPDAVIALRDDEELAEEYTTRGRDCYMAYHSQTAAAKKALEYYKEALALGAPRALPMQKGPYKTQEKDFLVGSEGMVILRYTGGNVGKFDVTGPITHTIYHFDGMNGRQRLVDARDAKELIKPRSRGKGIHRGLVEYEVVR